VYSLSLGKTSFHQNTAKIDIFMLGYFFYELLLFLWWNANEIFCFVADKHLKGILMHFSASDLSSSPSEIGTSFLRKNLPIPLHKISHLENNIFSPNLCPTYILKKLMKYRTISRHTVKCYLLFDLLRGNQSHFLLYAAKLPTLNENCILLANLSS